MKRVLSINGESREFVDSLFPGTVADLIATLELDPAMVVAEVNGDIVGRADFASHALQHGDSVELVRFVGGG